jgi:hypothetical protein
VTKPDRLTSLAYLPHARLLTKKTGGIQPGLILIIARISNFEER